MTVVGASVVIANLARVRQWAVEVTDEELASAAEFGANFTRAIAPIDTGAYRFGGVSRSGTVVPNGITFQRVSMGMTLAWAWGTPAPYGRRLELGFRGRDSLGRFYDDPARPHFGPSMDPTADYFIGRMLERGFSR